MSTLPASPAQFSFPGHANCFRTKGTAALWHVAVTCDPILILPNVRVFFSQAGLTPGFAGLDLKSGNEAAHDVCHQASLPCREELFNGKPLFLICLVTKCRRRHIKPPIHGKLPHVEKHIGHRLGSRAFIAVSKSKGVVIHTLTNRRNVKVHKSSADSNPFVIPPRFRPVLCRECGPRDRR